MPYRVDLIFYRKDFGYIGVEGKNINTIRKGSIIAKAIEQIQNKYKDKTYLGGNIISKWCIAFPANTIGTNERSHNEIMYFIRNFIKYKYNISTLQLNENKEFNSCNVSIDALSKGSLYFRND